MCYTATKLNQCKELLMFTNNYRVNFYYKDCLAYNGTFLIPAPDRDFAIQTLLLMLNVGDDKIPGNWDKYTVLPDDGLDSAWILHGVLTA